MMRMSYRRPIQLIALLVAAGLAWADGEAKTPTLTLVPGSSRKVQQLIGGKKGEMVDADWQTGKPLLNKTMERFNVGGCDLGYPFEHRGKLIVLFGDTIGPPNTDYFYAGDVMAESASADPEKGLALDFFTLPEPSPQLQRLKLAEPRNPDGSYTLCVEPERADGGYVDMGPFCVPASGIDVRGEAYVLVTSGWNGKAKGEAQFADMFSILTRLDDAKKTFRAGRTVSRLPGGHFVFAALVHGRPEAPRREVFFFGTGANRHSDVYLAVCPSEHFWNGEDGRGPATRYFTGREAKGEPTWSEAEKDAVPVLKDVAEPPTIGNLNVVYEGKLGLFLMTFDSFAQGPGVFFSHAPEPWGPWSPPQRIFANEGQGRFQHWPPPKKGERSPDQPGTHLVGPMIGTPPEEWEWKGGGEYAPYIVGRFTRIEGKTLSIYYVLSTWNPYGAVLMRSDFAIGP